MDFTSPEAMVEFSREKYKPSAPLKNPFVFHLETYLKERLKGQEISDYKTH